MAASEVAEVLREFFHTTHEQEIRDVLLTDVELNVHHSIDFQIFELINFHPEVGYKYVMSPDQSNTIATQELMTIQEEYALGYDDAVKTKVKINVHARPVGLPHPQRRYQVSEIRSEDVGQLIQFEGKVTRTCSCKMVESVREYMCEKCGDRFTVFADLARNNVIDVPKKCDGNAASQKCRGKVFTYVEGSRECCDYQEIRVQEKMQKLKLGSIPRQIKVIFFDNLVDKCQAGDDIIVVGEAFLMWNPLRKEKRCDVELLIKAYHVHVEDKKSKRERSSPVKFKNLFERYWTKHAKTPLLGRNKILANICPQLFGMAIVKLSVTLMVIGGVPRVTDNIKVRGQSHLLLVGDPGCGKSQLLRYAANLSDRSVLTTGIGTTSAGLTVGAVRDGKNWVLEAGALVLADGGICCIDEFGICREQDRGAIHEAMEQQTISVAKAGLVCRLKTRTSVFAVQNPKGLYDDVASLNVNSGIASPLLSRFDMVLLLLDERNPSWDIRVASHIMKTVSHDDNTRHATEEKADEENDLSDDDDHSELRVDWDIETMINYIQLIQEKEPKLTALSEEMIMRFYGFCRKTVDLRTERTTVRMLESLIRIAQAHARLMYRDIILPLDAFNAISLVEHSARTALFSGDDNSVLHTRWPILPDEEYKEQIKALLKKLEINNYTEEDIKSEFDYSFS